MRKFKNWSFFMLLLAALAMTATACSSSGKVHKKPVKRSGGKMY